jgi:hypothetical protein
MSQHHPMCNDLTMCHPDCTASFEIKHALDPSGRDGMSGEKDTKAWLAHWEAENLSMRILLKDCQEHICAASAPEGEHLELMGRINTCLDSPSPQPLGNSPLLRKAAEALRTETHGKCRCKGCERRIDAWTKILADVLENAGS